jgi:hypothetical protein
MPAVQLNSMLDHAVDRHFDRPAVLCDDHETDYERFDESVEWVSGDLAARGVQARQRIGLCMSGGWDFLIALHALLRLDVVVVPVNPYDEAALRSCRELDMHYFVSHRDADPFLEEMVATICGEEIRPIFDMAEVFTLVLVSTGSPLHDEGGLLLYDNGFRFSTASQVADRVATLQRNLELNAERCVVIHGSWSCPSAVLLVLASAASGSCVNVVPVAGRSVDVWAAASAGDTAVVFAQLMPMHEIVRIATTSGQGCFPPRMMLPDGEPLSEALIRRCGLTRHSPDDPPIYEFTSHTRSADPSTVPDFDCLCCDTTVLLTVS